MKPAKPRRTLLGGLGLVLLGGGVGSHPRHAVAEPPIAVRGELELDLDPDSGEPWATVSRRGAAPSPVGPGTLAGAAEPLEPLEPAAGSVSDGPLTGRPGAATALFVRDAATALRLLDAEPAPAEGSPPWFVVGALRGRALRMQGRPAEAVAVLEPQLAHPEAGKHFPRDLAGLELARARVAWAGGGRLGLAEADAQRKAAISELGKLRKLKDVRNLAVMRVLQARAMAGVEGGTERATRREAGRAVKALAKILADYPHHPDVGGLRLLHARALARAGKEREAGETLRRIVVERAGEPESSAAWAELESLAARSSKVRGRALSTGEQLEQAMWARGHRRVETSRSILDGILARPELAAHWRRQALRSRSYTAYKQRDFKACADDLRPMYEATGNLEVRDWLLRCLERGEMYDDALAIWHQRVESSRSSTRANGLWNGLQLAFRAGHYQQASDWLAQYEREFKGHASERAWLRPWLAYRLGHEAEAIEGFRAVAGRSGTKGRKARYFLGKLLLRSTDPDQRAEGTAALQQLAAANAWGYYGLMARQRLLDAGAETPPLPALRPVADESRRPSRAVTEARLADLDARFGEAWPPLRRARQLYEAGYLEEARRELRVATAAYLVVTQGRSPGPRNESLFVGLGWKSEWEYPRVRPTGLGRKTLRSKESADALRRGLRALSIDLSEPHGFAKLSTGSDGVYKARWHPRAYRASVEREARLRRVDPIHMWSLMYTESRFRRHVVSPVGARGALQIMPWTAFQLADRLDELPEDRRFNSDALFDIDTNVHLAGYYVAELLAKFHGQAPMAYASYNGGPSNVGRWLRAKSKEGAPLELDTFIEEIVFAESYRYTKRVTEVSAAYSMLYRGKLPRWSNEVDPAVEDNIAF